MEKLGIGRPSTYAPTIDTIQRRGYVSMEERRFHPIENGTIVNEMLEQYFSEIIDVDFTADMETSLDDIEEGKTKWEQVMDEFYNGFSKRMENAVKEMKEVDIKNEQA